MIAARVRSIPSQLASCYRFSQSRLAGTTAASFVVLGLMAVWGPVAARAWGFVGHRIAGQIAFDRLNPNAKKAVADLLDPGQTLSQASTWADEVRRDYPESATWHYVNVPITEAKYAKKYEDPKGGVVSKVADFQKTLSDKNAPRVERQKALKFLVHFLQDMHQPVHVGHRDDRGGNNLQVQFFDKGSNLHRVWDSDLLEHNKRPEPDYVQALEKRITPELATEWSKGTVEDWANESLEMAKKAYTNPGGSGELRKGAKLDQAYYATNLPLAEQRIEQAGVRLAVLLNAIFP